MYEEIYWHAFFKANTKDSAHKLLRKFGEYCETTTGLVSCERYWKDENLFDMTFTTPLKETDVSIAVFTALLTAHKLADSWNITGPYCSGSGIWEFYGLTTKTRITGIEWIEFRIETTT